MVHEDVFKDLSGLPCVLMQGTLRFHTLRLDVDHTGQRMDKPIVLIVDSEALIRISAVHMVEDAGFSVLEARNADEAIKLLELRQDIQAVFTDINMGGSMDALKLAHAIRKRWPPVHLLVASGADMKNKLPSNGRFIRKPYSSEQVARHLYELFEYNPAPGGLDDIPFHTPAKLA